MSSRGTHSPPAASREERAEPSAGREKQRSRTGCRTCRSRKVKCDESRGGCKNCERLNLPCPNSPSYHSDLLRQQQSGNSSASVSGTQAGLKRSRTYRSCRCCRVSKSRCSGERPICLRCRQRNLDCTYDGKEAPAWTEAISQDLRAGGSVSTLDVPFQERRQSSTPVSFSAGSSQDGNERRPPTSHPYLELENSLSWLMAAELPEKEQIVLLAEEYFANIHNLRSFGFIHKPSFMQQLDDHSITVASNNILLYIVCALGAKFYALKIIENSHEATLPEDFVLRAGTQWAEYAQQKLLADLNNVSVENAMAVVLLHDLDLRVGNFASAFMLTGLGVRMAQALQINLEPSTDILCRSDDSLPPSTRESRRRLAWAIYVMDAFAGQTLIDEKMMKIQLPCNERNFVFELPCVVQSLEPGSYLPFLSPRTRAEGSADDLDLIAHFIRLISLRRKVLRYVKHLGTLEEPWCHASEYTELEAGLAAWNEQLPSSLRFERASIYMRKESSQLGGLLFLHIAYHQTVCDLTQIAMRDLVKAQYEADFPVEQGGFKKKIQDECFRHAVSISTIFDEALRHGIDALADTWLSVVAHDSSRVIVHYLWRDLGTLRKDKQFKQNATSCLYSNLRALKKMLPLHALGKPLFAAAVNMIRKHGFELPASMEVSPVSVLEDTNPHGSPDYSQPLQFTPEYVLDPLSVFQSTGPGQRSSGKCMHDGVGSPERTHRPPPTPINRNTLTSGLALDTIHVSAAPTAADTQLLYGSTMPIIDNLGNMEIDDLQLPTSIDDLQLYISLMVNNNNAPIQQGYVAMSPSGTGLGGFGEHTAYTYPQPPGTSGLSAPGISAQFPVVTQASWPP